MEHHCFFVLRAAKRAASEEAALPWSQAYWMVTVHVPVAVMLALLLSVAVIVTV
jgi:hypothetical protein